MAARWGAAGEEYNCEDIRQHLGLDVCLQTIRKALQKRSKARWGRAGEGEGEGGARTI